jgi:hypothetical protein
MRIDAVAACQRYRVPLQLLDTEELRPQQFGILVGTRRLPGAGRKSTFFDEDDILLARARGLTEGPGAK